MKTSISIVMALALTLVVGCQTSGSQGGAMGAENGFKIGVPAFTTDVKQGELQTVTVSVRRGDFFKQDVKLEFKTAKGVSIEPASVTVKAGDKPDVQLRILADKDAAISEYRVMAKGTPKTGEPAMADFGVKVVAQ